MAKVTISTKVDEKLKEKLEAIAKENKQTLSQMIGEKLNQSIEKEESSLDEFSLVKSELAEKNKQIERLQQQLLNQQEIQLYHERQKTMQLEIQQEEMKQIAVNDSKNEKEKKEERRGLFNWFK